MKLLLALSCYLLIMLPNLSAQILIENGQVLTPSGA